MGLDIVEMVMAVEDEFDVEIPEEEAEAIRTVGDLRDYLVRKAEEAAAPPQARGWCRTQQAFYLLRATARRYRGAHCPRFGPGARLAQVMSPLQWHAARRYLGDRAAGVVLPDTRRGFLGWPVAHTDEAITFGDLARRIAGARQPVAGCRPPLGPEPDPAERDPEVIGEKLRAIVSFELGVPLHKVHYDSRFDEDLHAG